MLVAEAALAIAVVGTDSIVMVIVDNHREVAVVACIAVEFVVPMMVDHKEVVMGAMEVAGSFFTLSINI